MLADPSKPYDKLYQYQKIGVMSDNINDPDLVGLNYRDKQVIVPQSKR